MLFNEAIEIVLKHEGGYVNDPRDPGGETNFGISKRQYPELDIKNLTKKHACMIYQKDYWNKCKCEGLPEEMRLMVLDSAINMGVKAASMILQELLKEKPMDGIIGVKTLNSVKEHCFKFGAEDLLIKFAAKRIHCYTKMKNYNVYGNGWIKRTLEVFLSNINLT